MSKRIGIDDFSGLKPLTTTEEGTLSGEYHDLMCPISKSPCYGYNCTFGDDFQVTVETAPEDMEVPQLAFCAYTSSYLGMLTGLSDEDYMDSPFDYMKEVDKRNASK
jgi:hypothetical protein